MRLVLATAEPRGAYHLAPLAEAFAAADATLSHLVPYPEPVQGDPVVEVTTRTSVIDECDRLVVTGGTFSAWTELVARYAVSLGKPIVFSQLSDIRHPGPAGRPVPVSRASALSADGAESVARHLGFRDVVVTGTPSLDRLPVRVPIPGRVLMLSRWNMGVLDPERVLLTAAHVLRDRGWDVRVRIHPREDPAPWEGFTLVEDETPVESAASAQVVVGYPGSALGIMAAVGVPVISLAPSEASAATLTERQAAAVSAHARSADDVVALVDTVDVPDPLLVREVVGPIGGAAQRILGLWLDPL